MTLPATEPSIRREGAGQVPGRRRRPIVLGLSIGLVAVGLWVAGSLLDPRPVDFAKFDGRAVGRLDAQMWRSYYERKPVRLFWQLARSLQVQFHTGTVRSFPIAYRAARAAFVFKDGHDRSDYQAALPDLERYFGGLSAIARTPFDPVSAARNELEWWIVRREPARYGTDEWERLIAEVAAEIYHLPVDRVREFARGRVEAMVLRDGRGSAMTEADWRAVDAILQRSWASLAAAAADSVRESGGRR